MCTYHSPLRKQKNNAAWRTTVLPDMVFMAISMAVREWNSWTKTGLQQHRDDKCNAKQCQAVPSSLGALSGSNFPISGGLTMSWLRSKRGPCLRTCDLVKSVFILPSMHWFSWNWTGKPLKHIETYSGWWFQPLWKILVSWDYYSQYMEKIKFHGSKPPTSIETMALTSKLRFLQIFPIHGSLDRQFCIFPGDLQLREPQSMLQKLGLRPSLPVGHFNGGSKQQKSRIFMNNSPFHHEKLMIHLFHRGFCEISSWGKSFRCGKPRGNPLPLGNDRHSGWIFQRDFMVYCHITKGYHSYPTYYHRFMDPMNPMLDGAHLGR